MKKIINTLILTALIYLQSFGTMPDKVYAPYVDVMLWPTFDIMSCYNATGQKYYTLAFIIAGTDGQPAWGGSLNMASNHMVDQVNSLRATGGDVIISFGGANGTPIASTITDVNALVSAYESVINKYGITWIDFDIEGWWVQDQASIDRRNQAAAILQSRNPGLRITYCLPVMPYGLTSDGLNVINKAKAAGVSIYSVNVMAMDYGQSNQDMGQAAIDAANNTHTQTGLNIGITPMIGQNDTQNEIFNFTNASNVLAFAKSTSWINMLAMWSVNRDNGGCAGQTYASPTCSGLSQNQFDFVNTFKSFSGTSTTNGISGLSGTYFIINRNSGMAMDVANFDPANGTNILQWNQTGATNQQFRLTEVSTGVYSILCVATGKAVDIEGISMDNFANVHQWEYVNGSNQHFQIESTGDGYYKLRAMHSNKIIEVGYASLEADANINQYTDNNQICGQWSLVPVNSLWSIKIEAKNYSDQYGTQVEDCTEGGQNVGYIDAGDWLAYFDITFPVTGKYTVEYRVASLNGAELSLDLNAGTIVLGTVTIPSTGDWQSWTTVKQTVSIDAGTYNLGIYAPVSGTNINWIQITQGLKNAGGPETIDQTHEIQLFPSITGNSITLKGVPETAKMNIFNSSGQSESEQIIRKGESKVDVSGFKQGVYFVVVTTGIKKEVFRFIKE